MVETTQYAAIMLAAYANMAETEMNLNRRGRTERRRTKRSSLLLRLRAFHMPILPRRRKSAIA